MSLNIAELVEEMEDNKLAGDGQGGNFLENFVLMPEKDGYVTVRILPPGNDLPMLHGGMCMSTRVHTVNGRKVHCRKEKVRGRKYPVGECRICDHWNWLYRRKDELLRAKDTEGADACVREARAIKPVERYYFNVIIRKLRKDNGDEELNVGPKILSVGKTLKDRIIRAILGNESLEEASLGDITNPLTGRDLRIVKKIRHSGGESFPNYDDSKFIDPSPLGEPEQVKKWMAGLHDLHALRVVRPAEEVEEELKEYLGVVPSKRAPSYDPGQYTKSGSSLAGEVRDDRSAYSPSPLSSNPEFEEPETPSEALDNDSFFKALNAMG